MQGVGRRARAPRPSRPGLCRHALRRGREPGEKPVHLCIGDGATKQVALTFRAAFAADALELFFGFHAFGGCSPIRSIPVGLTPIQPGHARILMQFRPEFLAS